MDARADPERLRILAVTNMWPEGDSFRGIFVKEQVEALRRARRRGRRRGGRPGPGQGRLPARRAPDPAPGARGQLRPGACPLRHGGAGRPGSSARCRGCSRLYGHDVNWHWQRWITRIGWGGVAAKLYVSPRHGRRRRRPGRPGDPQRRGLQPVRAGRPAPAARTTLGFADGRARWCSSAAVPDNWVKGYDVFTDVLAELRGARPDRCGSWCCPSPARAGTAVRGQVRRRRRAAVHLAQGLRGLAERGQGGHRDRACRWSPRTSATWPRCSPE